MNSEDVSQLLSRGALQYCGTIFPNIADMTLSMILSSDVQPSSVAIFLPIILVSAVVVFVVLLSGMGVVAMHKWKKRRKREKGVIMRRVEDEKYVTYREDEDGKLELFFPLPIDL